MFYTLLTAYCLLLTFLTWKNFRAGVALLILTLPTYLIRFNVGPLPSTVLELNFGVLFLVWLLKHTRTDWPNIKKYFSQNKLFFALFSLFFLSSIIAVFISDQWKISFGHWRAFFLEPILFFLMLIGRRNEVKVGDLSFALVYSTLPISVVAVIQATTGHLFPPSLWDDELFGRATSIFTSPNAIGLYLAPIFFLNLSLFYKFFLRYKETKDRRLLLTLCSLFFVFASSTLAILFSKSVGTWIGLAAGLWVLVLLSGYKKIAIVGALTAIVLLILPPTQTLLKTKTRSLENRLTLWAYSREFLSASPKNFIFGTGIRQFFRKIQKESYYQDHTKLERLIYPHNILLNFWTEIGLLGMLGFAGIYYFLLSTAYSLYRHRDKIFGAVFLASLVAFLVHGLVDVPYFKNDLAFLFWTIAALIILQKEKHNT